MLIPLALLGGAIIFFVSKWGIGLSPDSCAYIGMARNFLRGQGFSFPSADGHMVPVTGFPPFFPLNLVALGVLGVDPLEGAKLFQSVVFGANLLLVGFILKRYSRSSRVAGLGAFLFLTSFSMLLIHSMAWSEPLFTFLTVGGLFLWSLYLEQGKRRFLAAATAVNTLNFLTRYVGATVIGASVVALILFGRKRLSDRVKEGLISAALSSFPLALWLARNYLSTRVVARGEFFGFHPPSLDYYGWALSSFSLWFLPQSVPSWWRGGIVFLAVASFIVAALRLKTRRAPVSPAHDEGDRPPLTSLFLVFTTFFVCYVATYYWVLTFLSTDPLDNRAAAPSFPVVLILFLLVGHRLWREWKGKTFLRRSLVALTVFFVVSYAVRAVRWGSETYREGLALSGRAWRNSEILGKVKSLPPAIPIYTNASEVVYFLTGRIGATFPTKGSGMLFHVKGASTRPGFYSEMAQFEKKLRAHGGLIIYLDRVTWRSYGLSENELKEYLPLQLVEKVSDGSIYKLRS